MKPGVAVTLLSSLLTMSTAWHASELGHGSQTGWATPQTLVVRDTAALRNAWSQLYPIASLRPARPAIDFTKYRVLVVAAGTKPTGGYRMALTDAVVHGDSATITVTLFTPASGCSFIESLTAPAVAIAVPVSPAAFSVLSLVRPDTARCN